MSIIDYTFGFLYRLFALCIVYPMLPVFQDCLLLITPSVFSNVYLHCVMSIIDYTFGFL